MTLRDLVIKIGLTTDEGFDKAVAKTTKGLKSVTKFTASLAVQMLAFEAAARVAQQRLGDRTFHANLRRLATMANVASVGVDALTASYQRFRSGLGLINEELIENARWLTRQADALKLSTDEFQQLSFAFEQFDLTQADVVTALERFARGAEDALRPVGKRISGAREEFEKLGIAVERLKGKNSLQILEEVAHAFKNATNQQSAKNAIYRLLGEDMSAIFGESLARRLIPALTDGAEGITDLRRLARDQGLVVDEDLLKQGKELAMQFGILTRQVNVFWQELGLRLVPATKILVGLWQDLITENREWINLSLDRAINVVTKAVELFDRAVRGIDWEFMLAIALGSMLWLQLAASIITTSAAGFLWVGTMLAISMAMKWLFGVTMLEALIGLTVYIFQTTLATLVTLGFDAALAPLAAVLLLVAGALGLVALAFASFAFYVGLSIAAVILAVDDLLAYMRGADSVLGRTLENWEDTLVGSFLNAMYQAVRILGETAIIGITAVNELVEVVLAAFGVAVPEGFSVFETLMRGFGIAIANRIRMLTFFFQMIGSVLETFADGLAYVRETIDGLSDSMARLVGHSKGFQGIMQSLTGEGFGKLSIDQVGMGDVWHRFTAEAAAVQSGQVFNTTNGGDRVANVNNYIYGGDPSETEGAVRRGIQQLFEGTQQ